MKLKFNGLSHKLGASMYLKVGALVAAVTIGVALFIMAANQIIINRAVQDGVLSLGATSTTSIASNSGTAILSGDTDRLNNALAEMLELSQGRAIFGVVLDADGTVLATQGDNTTWGADDLPYLANVAMQTWATETTGDGRLIAAPARSENGDIVGAVGFIWSSDQAFAVLFDQQIVVYGIATALFLVLSVLAAWGLRRLLTHPLQTVRDGVLTLTNGRFDEAPMMPNRRDEIGEIARAVEDLKQQLHKAEDLARAREMSQQNQADVVTVLNRALKRMSDGDLTLTIDDPFAPEYESLRRHFNSTHATMVSIIGAVIESSDRIRSSAEEIAQSSGDLAQRTESQAATLQQTAGAMEVLNNGVRSAADAAHDVEAIMGDARNTAEGSGEVVSTAVEAMSKIEESSKKITKILGLIDEIAFQTNLLALNAGVEAARAGEAGRGFAVVAAEVRALAQRSSDAAQDIKHLITESNDHIYEGVQLVGRTGEELEKLIGRVGTISERVTEIADSAENQSTTLNEINTGVGQLDGVTQHNAAMVEQTTAASQVLRNDAAQLARIVSVFKTGETATADTAEARSEGEAPADTASAEVFEDDITLFDAPDTSVAPKQQAAEPVLQPAAGWQDF